jgi:hypothetical protein
VPPAEAPGRDSAAPPEVPIARERAPQPWAETDVAPFADYIAVRRQPAEFSATLDLEYASQAAVAPFSSSDAEGYRASIVNPASLATPLIAPQATLALLQLGEGAEPADERRDLPIKYLDARQRREALMQRLCDPVVTLDDAAVLLGVSTATVRRHVERGALATLQPPVAEERKGRQSGRTAGSASFRLSDIVAFLAATAQPADA